MAKAAFQNEPLLTETELRARLGELYRALNEFNDGWYFESHETLEDLWMVTPLPWRPMFQGVIQAAAAFVHFFRHEYAGILKLLDASIEKLREFEPGVFGVDVSALIASLTNARNQIAVLGPERFEEYDWRAIPRVSFEREA